ncbi:Modifier of rudimentary (Mod(r)) protein [Euphorbia peplus]|nr:Modifier of rudimentary (Mod(r)) protein [Euphorbia peplus]
MNFNFYLFWGFKICIVGLKAWLVAQNQVSKHMLASDYAISLPVVQIKIQNNIRDELRKETMQLARENLENEPRIMELRNQCRIIRTTELAAAPEKLNELNRQKEEILKSCSPVSLLQKLQGNEQDIRRI